MKPRIGYPKPRPKKPKAKKGPNRVNRPRQKREHLRSYGPDERVEWVKTLPCCWCGIEGYTENAHTVGGGGSRKADAKTIAPLCGQRYMVDGCHYAYDHYDWPFNRDNTDGYDARQHVKNCAAETERLWQAHLA